MVPPACAPPGAPAPGSTRDFPALIAFLDVAAKGALLLLLLVVASDPAVGNLEGKGATARAIGYPLAAFTVPVVWWRRWRGRPFPWRADLLVTLTCFTDTLGNRLDLYDTVVWFDDVVHLLNPALLTAAVVVLSLPRTATRAQVVERSLAFGATAALAWEVAEYYAFLALSDAVDRYEDTLLDLSLGVLGALVAGLVVHRSRRSAAPRTADAVGGADGAVEPGGLSAPAAAAP